MRALSAATSVLVTPTRATRPNPRRLALSFGTCAIRRIDDTVLQGSDHEPAIEVSNAQHTLAKASAKAGGLS